MSNLFKKAIKFDFISAYIFWPNQPNTVSFGNQTFNDKEYIEKVVSIFKILLTFN